MQMTILDMLLQCARTRKCHCRATQSIHAMTRRMENTPWMNCPGCTDVVDIQGCKMSHIQPALPQCDICGWQQWKERKQPQWHDIDYAHYSPNRADWSKMMFGMEGATIVFRNAVMSRHPYSTWTTGTICHVRNVTVNVHSLTTVPEWLLRRSDTSTLLDYSGTGLWRLVGTQRVYFNRIRALKTC